jgi:hypothetical protein
MSRMSRSLFATSSILRSTRWILCGCGQQALEVEFDTVLKALCVGAPLVCVGFVPRDCDEWLYPTTMLTPLTAQFVANYSVSARDVLSRQLGIGYP